MSERTRRQIKIMLIVCGLLATPCVALLLAFINFIALPSFEEVARTGRVQVDRK